MYLPDFSKNILGDIHDKTMQVMEQVGMKVLFTDFYPYLRKQGAQVNEASNIVKFPRATVMRTIEDLRAMIAEGKKQTIMNGVVSSRTDDKPHIKFAGACIEFLDPESGLVRLPTEKDLVRLIKFGESLPEVDFIGNPVCFLRDENDKEIDPRIQRVKTAAIVAKHTTKYGSNEIWDARELDLMIELGSIVRGSREEFFKNPCFITAKETIAPFIFPEEDGRTLAMLAKYGLPCTIIPMPISGVTSPVTIEGNIVVTAAEVLGVMVCIHSMYPEAMISGGVISGVLDMRNGIAAFATPEAILQDIGAARLFEDLYGQDFGIGTGCVDAQYPSAQLSAEYFAKMSASRATGRCNYPVGNIGGAKRWSPQGALIGIEIAKYLHRFGAELKATDQTIPIEEFIAVGPAGSFLSSLHTAENFRDCIWMPELYERTQVMSKDDYMVRKTREKWLDFIKDCDETQTAVPREMEKEIDCWLAKAIKILS